MERMNGQVIVRAQIFAIKPAQHLVGDQRGREGAAEEANVSGFAMFTPLYPGFDAAVLQE